MLNSVVKKNKGRSQLAEALNHELAKQVCDAQRFFLLLTVPEIQIMFEEVDYKYGLPDDFQRDFSNAPYERVFLLPNDPNESRTTQIWKFAWAIDIRAFSRELRIEKMAPIEMRLVGHDTSQHSYGDYTECPDYKPLRDFLLEQLSDILKEPEYWVDMFETYLVDGIVYRNLTTRVVINPSDGKYYVEFMETYPLTGKDKKTLRYSTIEYLRKFYSHLKDYNIIYPKSDSNIKRSYDYEIHGFADKYYLYKKYLEDKNFLNPKWDNQKKERPPIDERIQSLWDEYEEQRKGTDAHFETYMSGICSDFNKILEDILSIPLTKLLR